MLQILYNYSLEPSFWSHKTRDELVNCLYEILTVHFTEGDTHSIYLVVVILRWLVAEITDYNRSTDSFAGKYVEFRGFLNGFIASYAIRQLRPLVDFDFNHERAFDKGETTSTVCRCLLTNDFEIDCNHEFKNTDVTSRNVYEKVFFLSFYLYLNFSLLGTFTEFLNAKLKIKPITAVNEAGEAYQARSPLETSRAKHI